MFGEKVYLTKEGHIKLTEELAYLKSIKRKEISKDIEKARSFGDLSENAEYDAAKETQALNEKKINEIEDSLSNAQIIENLDISNDQIRIGATVKIKNLNTSETLTYTLVSGVEVKFSKQNISISSPIGKSLLGHAEGDIVEVKLPNKTAEYEILEITR